MGIATRCWRLPAQILGGDELHAIRALRSLSFPDLLYTYRLSDHSLALSSFYKLWLAVFGSIDWVALRALPLLSGSLLLVLGALAIGRDRGWSTGAWWAALAATSPSLVYFSRIARPYGPALFAASACLFCFHSWWIRERRGLGGYVAFGTLAVWFHPLTLPFVAMPILFGLADLRLRRTSGGTTKRDLRSLIHAGFALSIGLATFFVPGALSLLQLLQAKAGQEHLSARTTLSALGLIAGTHDRWVAIGFFALAFYGWFRWMRQRPRTGWYVASLLVVPGLAIALLQPTGIADPKVLHRYLLPTVPLLLLCIASVASPPPSRSESPRRTRASALHAVALLGLLLGGVATGPIATREYFHSNLAHHGQYLLWNTALPRETGIPIPSVYRAARAAGGGVLEFPWIPEWRYSLAPLLYQRYHHRPVVVAIPLQQLNVEEIELPSTVPPDLDSVLSSGARFVVVHLDPAAEERRARSALSSPSIRYNENLARMEENYRHSAERIARQLRARLGPPQYAEAAVLGWDLAASTDPVRSGDAARPDQ